MWRNVYADHPIFAGKVSFGDAFDWTTQHLSPAVLSVLRQEMSVEPCASDSIGAAELVARIAQWIQCLGDVTGSSCGVAERDGEKRTAQVFFSCRDTFLAYRCLSLAVQIVDRMVQPDLSAEGVAKMLRSCPEKIEPLALQLRTREMIEAAERRGIPWHRISVHMRHVQLGQGHRQHRFWNTIFDPESALARDYAANKIVTLTTLDNLRLPVGRFAVVKDAASASRVAEKIGYPLVLKPVNGMQGDSVYVDLRDETELHAALALACVHERPYMVQSLFPGDDHRLLVVSGKLVAAASRVPASVTGDGRRDIAELVEIENRDPRRISRQSMAPIDLDEESDRILARQGYTRASIPDAGCVVRVKATANISTGGTALDVMDIIHPDNALAAIRAARAIGVTIAGVDFISPDISKSFHDVGGGICEVNDAVGLRPHYLATPDLDVRGKLIEAFYPEGDDGRIPTAMITGTFGKTTTTLMVASILTSAGHTVGSVTTESLKIADHVIVDADLAGVDGASIVLRDPLVTAAVLETARGGLVKNGMYLDRCDVAALLNVQREQIDMDGIETVDDMAALKRKVLDAARKAVVLNADDPRCLALAPEFSGRLRTFLFSRHAGSAALRDHVARGGDAVFLAADQDGRETIMVVSGTRETALLGTADVPVTRGGLLWQHSSNAMAAAALAIGLGIDPDTIRTGLRRYGKEVRPAACRLAFEAGFPVDIMFDFAASPPGFAAAITVTDTIPVSGKRICAVTVPGNRPDWVFAEAAAALAGHFQRYVFFELKDYRRGRKPGEISTRLADAMLATGVDTASVSVVDAHTDVATLVAREAKPGDLVIVFGMDKPKVIEQYRAAFRDVDAGSPAAQHPA
jgi:cyanophycin synthetase